MPGFKNFTYRPAAFLGTFMQIAPTRPETEIGVGPKMISFTEELSREHAVLERILMAVDSYLVRADGDVNVDLSPIRLAAQMIDESVVNHHMRYEEKYLYPRFSRGKMASFANVLQKQHDQAREANREIMRLCGEGRAADRDAMDEIIFLCRSMKDLLTAHAAWEETVLFTSVYNKCSENDIMGLNQNMRELEEQFEKKGGMDKVYGDLSRLEQMCGTDDPTVFNLR